MVSGHSRFFYCPNAGYGFEDKSFLGKEGRENEHETGKKHGELDQPASRPPGLQGGQQEGERAVPQFPDGLQDSQSPPQGEKGGLTGAGKRRTEDKAHPFSGRGDRKPVPGGMA